MLLSDSCLSETVGDDKCLLFYAAISGSNLLSSNRKLIHCSMTSGPLAGKTLMAGAKITWEAASFTWLVPELG